MNSKDRTRYLFSIDCNEKQKEKFQDVQPLNTTSHVTEYTLKLKWSSLVQQKWFPQTCFLHFERYGRRNCQQLRTKEMLLR